MVREKIIGFIVNPIAGMGGRVGLKGTDGEAYFEALRRGAKPVSPIRALEYLNNLRPGAFKINTAPGPMGYDIVVSSIHRDKLHRIIDHVSTPTTAEDTKRIAAEMVDETDLIVFVGGDGTARDILDAVDRRIPVLGVPSGVKMYSAVFAVNPREAARITEEFIRGNVEIVEREVLDIDEEAFRRDRLVVKLYGYLLVPVVRGAVQSGKTMYMGGNEEENKLAIAQYIVENMDEETLYILGPGTTVKTIYKLIGVKGSLLGVDLLYKGELIAVDVGEKEIINHLERIGKAVIIVTPIGGQGFIFGRGNQQISPQIIRRVGKDNILIVATRRKIMDLEYLRVDTGDPEVDDMLRGYWRVLVDYNMFVVKKVV